MPVLTVPPTLAAVSMARGLTCADLAREFKVSRNTVQRWANRKRCPPVAVIRKLVALLAVDGPEDLGYTIVVIERAVLCAE